MSTTLEVMEKFEEVVNNHCVKKVDYKEILDVLGKVNSTIPPIYHQDLLKDFLENRAKLMNKLLDDTLVAKIKYPLISPDLFKLKRQFQVVYNKNEITVTKDGITMPDKAENIWYCTTNLFVYMKLNEQEVKLGNWSWSYNATTWKIEIKAKMPCVLDIELKKACRIALADVYSVLSECLNMDAIGDCLSEKIKDTHPELGLVWIPTIDSLEINIKKTEMPKPKTYDPAIVLTIRGMMFLVKLFTIKNEEPLEHFLREYTMGPEKVKVIPG